LDEGDYTGYILSAKKKILDEGDYTAQYTQYIFCLGLANDVRKMI